MLKDFIEIQQRIIVEIIRQILVVQSIFQSSSKSSNNFELFDLIELNEFNNNDTSRWNAANFDFFDFFYNGKSANIDNVIKHINKNIYFRDVRFFIERARDVITIKNVELIRENL